MSSAKRRINSTGRGKITRDHVDIRMLENAPGEPLRAKMKLNLAGLRLPETASVVTEAYFRSSSMKFDCGQVGLLSVPDVMELNEIDQSGSVLFRIKVVDTVAAPGKILAAASRLRPACDVKGEGRRSLFPILHRDLGDELWRVTIDDAGPSLLLNNRVAGFTAQLMESPLLQAVLLPAALRQVMMALADDPADDDDDGEGGWKTNWLRYCNEELAIENPPDGSDADQEERAVWVDDAVQAFCRHKRFIENIREKMGAAYNA